MQDMHNDHSREDADNFPLVSFLLISYKHADYIEDCMKSIVEQSYPRMEILYLDDASGDGTFEKALFYQEALTRKFERVEFRCNAENQGLIRNLNGLVQEARGKYVKFLAADDFMLADGIEKMAAFMESNPEYDMAYSNGIMGDSDIRWETWTDRQTDRIYAEAQPSGRELFSLLYQEDFIAAPTVMTRRSVYEKLGLYDEKIGVEDWEYYLRIAQNGSIGYLDESTVMYRIVESSLSHSASPARRKNMQMSKLRILEKYKENVEDSQCRMQLVYNESLSDAYHIADDEYMEFLRSYASTNGIRISLRNRMKGMLYRLGVIDGD